MVIVTKKGKRYYIDGQPSKSFTGYRNSKGKWIKF